VAGAQTIYEVHGDVTSHYWGIEEADVHEWAIASEGTLGRRFPTRFDDKPSTSTRGFMGRTRDGISITPDTHPHRPPRHEGKFEGSDFSESSLSRLFHIVYGMTLEDSSRGLVRIQTSEIDALSLNLL
jgi:hypothetical protein